ncbi:hypothetical protein DPMN_126488 [Dreissena polymorpha]|uniref:Uncharacterized protein n=1 Tax=Dreissena polymorpha TaxID=45954 RepID=A0A9D4GX58_DREPO|nr:hypothetical protein DPMN_126488 [Dreissena polymorpha]
MNADTLNMETIFYTQQLSVSDDSKKDDNRYLMVRWYVLLSKNDDVYALQGSVDMAVRQTGLLHDPDSVNQGCEISVFKGNSLVLSTPTLNAAGISDKRTCLNS